MADFGLKKRLWGCVRIHTKYICISYYQSDGQNENIFG
uniref:Uncharacterized protein n=1 Tax=Rhizophora mucronata TaxID=61149 RepID=A0A2P2R245_RHIMU